MYRETRHPEHPGADGVLGVNTSTLTNIRFLHTNGHAGIFLYVLFSFATLLVNMCAN